MSNLLRYIVFMGLVSARMKVTEHRVYYPSFIPLIINNILQ